MLTARVSKLPECDIHKYLQNVSGVPANYDGRNKLSSSWAYMCTECYDKYGIGLGTGIGQRLVVA